LIDVENLTKRYGDKVALNDISFSIDKGEVVGLLGNNGAGKSTIMNIITGYISATSGTVLVSGHEIGRKAKALIGYLPEQPSFYPEMRVDEHLYFICELKGVIKKNWTCHVSDICKRVGISDVQKRMIRNLSKGYRQRVGFAQALIGHPKLVILDEPTAGLDPSQIIEMRKQIKDCGQESTVIISSHILPEIQAICDRVIVINKGNIVADSSPAALIGNTHDISFTARIKGELERVTEVLLKIEGITHVESLSEAEPGVYDYVISGDTGKDFREDLFYALAGADLPILLPYKKEASLEEVFMQLTKHSSM